MAARASRADRPPEQQLQRLRPTQLQRFWPVAPFAGLRQQGNSAVAGSCCFSRQGLQRVRPAAERIKQMAMGIDQHRRQQRRRRGIAAQSGAINPRFSRLTPSQQRLAFQ